MQITSLTDAHIVVPDDALELIFTYSDISKNYVTLVLVCHHWKDILCQDRISLNIFSESVLHACDIHDVNTLSRVWLHNENSSIASYLLPHCLPRPVVALLIAKDPLIVQSKSPAVVAQSNDEEVVWNEEQRGFELFRGATLGITFDTDVVLSNKFTLSARIKVQRNEELG
jgi:hypothetical protein